MNGYFDLELITRCKSKGLPHLSTIEDPDSFFAVIFTALLPISPGISVIETF